MSEIFPRINPKLSIATGIEAPTAVRPVETIKQDVILKLSQIGLGNQVQAEVIAKLEDGSYVAKVAGMPMRLDLPRGTQIGDNLALRLSRLSPRVAFLLERSHHASLPTTLPNKAAGLKQEISLLPTMLMDRQAAQVELTGEALHTNISTKQGGPIAFKPVEASKHEVMLKLSQLGFGNPLKAEVIAKLGDGSYTAKVAGMLIRLDLPSATQVGDNLALRLTRLTPQISFRLENAFENTSQHPNATTMDKANVMQHDILLLAPQSGYQVLEADVPVFTAATTLHATSETPLLLAPHNSKQIASYAQAFQNAQEPQSTQLENTSQHPNATTMDKANVMQHDILLLAPQSGYQVLEADVPVFTAATTLHTASVTPPLLAPHNSTQIASYAQVFQNTHEPQSTQTELSPAGQLISHLLSKTVSTSGKSFHLPDSRPLIASAVIGQQTENLPAVLENQLKKVLTQSGLFYESHVIDFLQGKKSRVELAQEPQAKIAQAQEQMAIGEKTPLDTTEEMATNNIDNVSSESILLNQSDTQTQAMTEIVRQQLDILEHNKLSLSGLLTPQIPFTWQVVDSDASTSSKQQSDTGDRDAMVHHSFLKVELPQLGIVSVQINLQANQVQLSFKSESDFAVQELNSHLNGLALALKSSGTTLQSFRASRDEQV